jgi:hypothetical protein
MFVAVSAAPFVVLGVAIVAGFAILRVRTYLGEHHPVDVPESMKRTQRDAPDEDGRRPDAR